MEKFTADELKSGYLVKLRNGEHRMVMRAGKFTKVLAGHTKCNYLSDWDTDKLTSKKMTADAPRRRKRIELDIMEVYGLVEGTENYDEVLLLCTAHRKLLWKRTVPKKLTVNQVSELLGYPVEIIGEPASEDTLDGDDIRTDSEWR